ncbi:MAG: hypothetical protein ACTSQE_04280 [Candidatus Heimdallarchaeaceae archaeon]
MKVSNITFDTKCSDIAVDKMLKKKIKNIMASKDAILVELSLHRLVLDQTLFITSVLLL